MELLNMHARKEFLLYNIIISCLILFFPIYEIFLTTKIIHFICFDICNWQNFFIYVFILCVNSNLIYLYMDDRRIAFLEKSFRNSKRLKYESSMSDLVFSASFFKLKFNEFLFVIRSLFKNKILYYYFIYIRLVRYDLLNIFVVNLWRPLFRRISYFGIYSTYFLKKNKNIYNKF